MRDSAAVPKSIRLIALALIRRRDEVLVEEGRDEVKTETFFRLLGAASSLARGALTPFGLNYAKNSAWRRPSITI